MNEKSEWFLLQHKTIHVFNTYLVLVLVLDSLNFSYAELSFAELFDGGFFDGWNVTQLITENEHDEIFHAFEDEVSNGCFS